MSIDRTLVVAVSLSVAVVIWAAPVMAQNCTRRGEAVSCDDGRRGIFAGDAIIWPDGTRSSATPHPSVIIGNKSSVRVGQGVFVGQGRGVVPSRRSQRAEQDPLRDSRRRVVLLLNGSLT